MSILLKICGYILFGIGFLFVNIFKFLVWVSVCVLIGLTFILNLEHGVWLALLATVIGAVITGIGAWILNWLASIFGLILLGAGAKLIEIVDNRKRQDELTKEFAHRYVVEHFDNNEKPI